MPSQRAPQSDPVRRKKSQTTFGILKYALVSRPLVGRGMA